MTLRAMRILKEVEVIAAEDTRQTRKLTSHFDIRARLLSYHEHNRHEKGPEIIALLKEGKSVALVSDAGLPGISDPGEDLVRLAVQEDLPVVAIPGASASLTALVVSGLPTSRFAFEGFLPRGKKERKARLQELAADPRTLIFYEAPHRLRGALADLEEVFGTRTAAACRELTKKFEEVIRAPLPVIRRHFEEQEPRGEFTLVVAGAADHSAGAAVRNTDGGAPTENAGDTSPGNPSVFVRVGLDESVRRRFQELSAVGEERKEAMKTAAREFRISKRDVYRIILGKD
ncbi:MAG: 16S rRNA (cytidine(1402)-2'-O)-methyltransferase [Actinobacteria bacterium]|nr:16S rRNA (cytidine(1402)-2'-O)-methyltransferase [Actinomycetota bacterium]